MVQLIRTIFTGILIFLLEKGEGQELAIGDLLPDIEYREVINYNKPVLKLADYKGKLLIIDLWNHRCASCIESFPKMEALQKLYYDKIQIILVNRESKDSTEKFFAKRKKLRMPNLPMVTGDTMFVKLFSPRVYPYHIWIDAAQKIRYISGGYNTTSEHIGAFLAEEELDIKNLEFEKTKYGSYADSSNNMINSKFEYISYLSHCNEGLDVGNTEGELIRNGETIRMAANCSSILQLYKKAFKEFDRYNLDPSFSVIVDVKDSFRIMHPKNPNDYDRWEREHAYRYELVIPVKNKEMRYKMMQEDLKRFFNYDASIVKKKLKTFVLVRKWSINKISKKNDRVKNSPGGVQENDRVIEYRNSQFSEVVNRLRVWSEYEMNTAFADESNYDGKIDIKLNKGEFSQIDMPLLRKELKKFGFDIVERIRETAVLVISE